MIAHEDQPTLKRAGIGDELELALCVPASYHDYRIKPYLDLKEPLLEIEVGSSQKLPKFLKIEAYAKNIDQKIELIFFHTSAYHYQVFKEGATLYVSGRVQKSFGNLQLIQPKKIANYKVGRIFAEHKVPIRGDIFDGLKKKYLTKEALVGFGLPPEVIDSLLGIHFPNEEFFRSYQKRGEFWGKYLKALKFTEAFVYLRGLKHKRVHHKALCQEARWPQEWLDSLPFTPTSDQLQAMRDIYEDLRRPIAARRVVVGDVGSGKSLVMFGTAMMNYPKRTILMAPTTILADQLYSEAKRLLPESMKVGLLSSENSEEDLEAYDFLIGTHALLYKKLPKACVVMVDEQHRFGTEQRNRLKKLVENEKGSPHFFQFSATPIPRTKAMMQSALVDFSFIKQTPFVKDITTKVIGKKDFKELLAHITKEIKEGRQVLVVYPLVERSENFAYKSLEEAASFWQKRFDGVFVTHGKDREKEEILRRFKEEGSILLSTTVVEVGISLPRLSTVVVVGAEHLGLATLHQLRGRVSRTGLKGYCFLYTNDENNQRLQEFAKIRSGFEIAELDLKYRKSGDILSGKEQSGKSFRWLSLAEDREIIEEVQKVLQ